MSGMDAASARVFQRRTTCKAWGRLAAVTASLVIASCASAQSLEKRVSTALAQARLGSAHVGVSVLDISTGQQLVDLSAGSSEAGFAPASNLKLLTSGAAFLVLGKDFEFQTKIIADGDRLIVLGAGDPGFAEPKLLDAMHLSVDQFMDRLVDSVKTAGVTGLREIVVDDRVFDRDFVHPDWPREQLSRSYCAGVSGLNFHANLLNVYVTPGGSANAEVGARPEPSGSWITITRLARTVREGNTEVWLEREPASAGGDPFRFKLHGTVRTALTEPIQVTVDQPGLFFGRALADRASRAGLGISGGAIAARLVGPDETLPTNTEKQRTVTVVRTPLSVALERCNVDSENLYAESLCKLIGHKVTGQPGTWGSGTAVVRMQIKDKLGAEAAASLVLADGSGLSKNNRITPSVMTRWLKVLSDDANGQEFIQSLAIAGEEGTLRKRFKGAKLHNEVRAKSGYIRGVRTLSGYVTNAATGKRVAFSVLCDNLPSDTDARAKEFHEQVVEAVDAWLYDKCKQVAATNAPNPPAGSGRQQASPVKPTDRAKRVR
jgi:serine-type D-Ala-D-Ala carboxypeptidase/endopeptidase (penicillin-binding protein 4)